MVFDHLHLRAALFWNDTLKSDDAEDTNPVKGYSIDVHYSHSFLTDILFHTFWSGSVLYCSRPQKSPFHPRKCEYMRLHVHYSLFISYIILTTWFFSGTCVCVCVCHGLTEELDGADRSSRCGQLAPALRQHAVWETHPHLCQQTQQCKAHGLVLDPEARSSSRYAH